MWLAPRSIIYSGNTMRFASHSTAHRNLRLRGYAERVSRSPHFRDYCFAEVRGSRQQQRLAAQSESAGLWAQRLPEQAELRQRDGGTPRSQFRRAKGCNCESIASWPPPLWLWAVCSGVATVGRTVSAPHHHDWRSAPLLLKGTAARGSRLC